MRYLERHLRRDLTKKMVLLSGPRQTGKSTLAKSLMDAHGVYLNWDVTKDRKIIRTAAWPKDASLVILDELHKFLKWKNFLKGIADEYQNKPPILVTGSAKLDTFRKQGDALTGRQFHYRLHPIDVAESKTFLPKVSVGERINRLLITGGFPEAFLQPNEAERSRNDRFELVLQEDLRDLSKSNSLRGMQLLIELLRERVGKQLNYSNLSDDVGVTPPTVKLWVELLERLYIVFLVPPFSRGLARSLKKEPRIFFYDCAAAYENGDSSARLENLVACSLLKYCQLQKDSAGKNFQLFYFRDREKREVDFVVTLNHKPHSCIEVKTSDENVSAALAYLHARLNPIESIQIVLNQSRKLDVKGIKVLPLGPWLEELGSG